MARIARLRKGPVFAAPYPIVVLVAQLIIGVVAVLTTVKFLTAVLASWAALFGVVVLPSILIGFRKLDNRIYAYYLMKDYAFSAQQRGAYPTALKTRIKGFQAQIAQGLKSDVDEVLVIGHLSGAYLAVSVLAYFLRENDAAQNASVLNFLSLGQVMPMVAFLPAADRLRAISNFYLHQTGCYEWM